MLNMFPKYEVYCHNNNRFLLSAVKKKENISSNYVIITSKDVNTSNKSRSYIGKLRSNFMGLEFNAYDAGNNVKETKNNNEIRKMLVTIIYVRVPLVK